MKPSGAVLHVTFAASLLFAPTAAKAQAGSCDARTFHDMYRCAVVRFEQADAEHKRVYQDVAVGLEAVQGGKLREADEAWVRYRAAHCEFESSRSAGRREYQVVRLRCMAELTEARTASLREEVEPTPPPRAQDAPEAGDPPPSATTAARNRARPGPLTCSDHRVQVQRYAYAALLPSMKTRSPCALPYRLPSLSSMVRAFALLGSSSSDLR
jgi:uncharacterized protein YecT (DUF1311 family)